MKNRNLYIGIMALAILIYALANQPKMPTQSIVKYQACFNKEDCKVPVKEGFCGVKYDCQMQQCYASFSLCAEICDNSKDEDYDGKIDCKDSDCWTDPYCNCARASFGQCQNKECFCPTPSIAKWVVTEGDGNCHCVGPEE